MTTFPTDFDRAAAVLLETELPPELSRHRAILNTHLDVQQMDELIFGPDSPALDNSLTVDQQIKEFTDLLAQRLTAGRELARLLSADACTCTCTCPTNTGTGDRSDEPLQETEFAFVSGSRVPPPGVLHAVLGIFADLGDPDALASADLVAALRTLPGTAEGRWRYADLTHARLAQLLAPYEVQSRDITLPDGRRRKSYRLSALLAAADR
ncbi:DUF3631 domain-containing protein [Streptomyces sp. NPDC004609]|uniref:DUF3631 domain-containing protein n=1 Tax=Streptomyces sp. NPDC004609 TaxID=3364704 RepID=UPI0036749634